MVCATCGHVTSVTSLLPYRGKAGSCSPVYPINIDFLSYKIHLSKNCFWSTFETILTIVCPDGCEFFCRLLAAMKSVTSISFSADHSANMDLQFSRAHSETASILRTNLTTDSHLDGGVRIFFNFMPLVKRRERGQTPGAPSSPPRKGSRRR